MANPFKITRQASQDYSDSGLSFSDMLKEELNMVAPSMAYKEGESPVKFVDDTTFQVNSKIPVQTVEAAIKRATDRMMTRLMSQGGETNKEIGND